jgi:hypothetical protein
MKSKEDISAVFDFIRFVEDRTDDSETSKALEMAANTIQWISTDKKETVLFEDG